VDRLINFLTVQELLRTLNNTKNTMARNKIVKKERERVGASLLSAMWRGRYLLLLRIKKKSYDC